MIALATKDKMPFFNLGFNEALKGVAISQMLDGFDRIFEGDTRPAGLDSLNAKRLREDPRRHLVAQGLEQLELLLAR